MLFRPIIFFVALLPAIARAEKPAVVELFEDDADGLIAQLISGGIGGSEDVRAVVETEDVFAGKTALRVAPAQRFHSDIKGWSFPIAEKPKAGEYRYLRFAWKKLGDGPLMLQFHTRLPGQDWCVRYHAGGGPPWPALEVSPTAPSEWVLQTRDLFKDFGAVTLGGVAFTPLHGGDGLFDHMLLGRTVEDLDNATAATLMKTPRKVPMAELRLKQLWTDLGSADEIVVTTAIWTLVAGRKESIPFLLKNATIPERKGPLARVDAETAKPLIDDLTHFRHVKREAALDELTRLGDGALPHLRKAAETSTGETKVRLTAILDRWTARTGLDDVRLRRCATVLRVVDAPEAKVLLAKIEKALP